MVFGYYMARACCWLFCECLLCCSPSLANSVIATGCTFLIMRLVSVLFLCPTVIYLRTKPTTLNICYSGTTWLVHSFSTVQIDLKPPPRLLSHRYWPSKTEFISKICPVDLRGKIRGRIYQSVWGSVRSHSPSAQSRKSAQLKGRSKFPFWAVSRQPSAKQKMSSPCIAGLCQM